VQELIANSRDERGRSVLRVTANTNIYILALNFGGMPDKLLDLARAGEIQLSISEDIMDEVMRVLRDNFGWSQEALDLARVRIADFTGLMVPTRRIEAVKEDPTTTAYFSGDTRSQLVVPQKSGSRRVPRSSSG
jgi:hypothetical protein